MPNTIFTAVRSGFGAIAAAVPLGIKSLKYFIDSTFREQVTPVLGSVLYCDLWIAVEHSGIYVGDGDIANIVVDGVLESTVSRSSPRSFTSKSTLGHKIYVSCDSTGVIGNQAVGYEADSHVGEQAFYGLVIKNCHQFSTKCVNYMNGNKHSVPLIDQVIDMLLSENWEPTLVKLKATAREKMGASKWRLWDWNNDIRDNPPPEPDWQAHEDFFRHQPLNTESISNIRAELAATREYEEEIADENIPAHIRKHLFSYQKTLIEIEKKYEEVKAFLSRCPGSQFSYADLQICNDDFKTLAQLLEKNKSIKELVSKLGRSYISEEKKRQTRIPEASKSEVHGTCRSNDLQRLLPSELLNLEDDELEMLFYARLLEQNLQTYELSGISYSDGETTEFSRKRTGPVVACLDTSASMAGEPQLKAKALLLAIANILKQENRSLHVLLFGSRGELHEYSMKDNGNLAGLLQFLQQSFGSGTDFETPLKRAFALIASQDVYLKADVLMISDGDCVVSQEYAALIGQEKRRLDCSVYSVLCAGSRVIDNFSDELVVL